MTQKIQLIKKNWIYLLFAFAVVFFLYTFTRKHREERPGEIRLEMKTFHTGLGWGYDILTNDTIYIHQESMPSAPGRKGFETESEARIVGNRVIDKIKSRKMPTISLEELDSLGIKR